MAEKETTSTATTAEATPTKKSSVATTATTSTFTKVRNVANRPLEINFSDGTGCQRIASKSVAYVDEERIDKDSLAKAQLDRFVANNCLRIIKKNCKKGE